MIFKKKDLKLTLGAESPQCWHKAHCLISSVLMVSKALTPFGRKTNKNGKAHRKGRSPPSRPFPHMGRLTPVVFIYIKAPQPLKSVHNFSSCFVHNQTDR